MPITRFAAILAQPPPSTSGLGRHPFKVVARVRIPLGALTAEDPAALRATMMIFGGFAFRLDGPCAAKARSATDVRLACPGRLAQLGERLPYKQEVGGSIPSPPIG